ncbi:hypothetical protein AX16_009751 [Volvariella volvacea WC 439]|nr:hypothetical protein AX16_009751 [Volvariella volvacea WC 439]
MPALVRRRLDPSGRHALYLQDIVQRISPPHSYGVVLRCWHDAEDIQFPPHIAANDAFMRTLVPGEVGVSFLVGGLDREIVPESELRLVDRVFQPGDMCKRSVDDVRSGVVTRARVQARLEHVVSGQKVPGLWTSDQIAPKRDADIGDYVVFDDWLGQTFDEALIELSNGQLIRLPELSTRLVVGEKGKDIIPHKDKDLAGLNHANVTGLDTVVAVNHTIYAIAWLAINQFLDPSVLEAKQRPRRFWSGPDIAQLTVVRGRSELEMRVGDRVHIKDAASDLPVTFHGRKSDHKGIVHVKLFLVAETQTMIDVLWQDGAQETIPATGLIPYLNPDEYDCWPGDFILWKCENQKRPAIVQSVNADDRTARVLFPDTSEAELISVLELDPYGATEPQADMDGLGLRRGEFVFIHRPGTTNGFLPPMVPRIGEVEPWVRSQKWRAEMQALGEKLAQSSDNVEYYMSHPRQSSGQFNWIGEVTGLNLDGTVEVTHPDGNIGTFPLNRLTRLYDGLEQIENNLLDQMDTSDTDDQGGDEVWHVAEHGLWEPLADPNEDGWMDEDTGDSYIDEGTAMDLDGSAWPSEDSVSDLSPNLSSKAHQSAPRTASPAPELQHQLSIPSHSSTHAQIAQPDQTSWARFSVLPSAPLDHAFLSSEPTAPSKAFLARLSKEYRILSTSLPGKIQSPICAFTEDDNILLSDSIIIRAYEDRTDLLRSLIIGPENTPYADAPFVIDWMLGSDFPQTPPVAHFWSWTNGNGRGASNVCSIFAVDRIVTNGFYRCYHRYSYSKVNPNLYEEGKVCLSILGTWAGDKNETWSAARSSLLQAFVSIQGLVLVKEPWFCEPAYEKLRGTEEGTVNSRLYSEKAYVLSRGFVRRALELPLGGLEKELQSIYYDDGRLKKVVEGADALIRRSQSTSASSSGGHGENTEEELAVPKLSAGGIITLERTLKILRDLLDKQVEAKI